MAGCDGLELMALGIDHMGIDHVVIAALARRIGGSPLERTRLRPDGQHPALGRVEHGVKPCRPIREGSAARCLLFVAKML